MALILKGSEVTKSINERISAEALGLREGGVAPTLAILRIGERPDDVAYERSAMKRMTDCAIDVRRVLLPVSISQRELLGEIEALNVDDSVHGVLMFRPMPKHIDERAATEALSPLKDVDGMTSCSMSGLYSGSGEGFVPCTAQAVIELLDYYKIELTGKRVAVIGRSLVIGRPLALLLINRNATVTVCHTKTVDIPGICRDADIIIAAVGTARAITAQHVSPGQVIIDVGVNMDGGTLCGDVDFAAVEPMVSAITPVPGGVGGVTSSVLASHVVQAARRFK